MLEITCFLKKYIDLMRCDKHVNALLFILFILICIVMGISTALSILFQYENLDTALLKATEYAMTTLMSCGIVHRVFNRGQVKRLIALIDGDEFAIDGRHLMGRKELQAKIENYCEQNEKSIRVIFRNLAIIFLAMLVFTMNRNLSSYLLGSEKESSNWPTPYSSYTPPELKSTVFFIYTYILHALLMTALCSEAFFIIASVVLATERILANFGIIYILLEDISHNYGAITDYDNEQLRKSSIQQNNSTEMLNLKDDLKRITQCHQWLNRNFKICTKGTRFMISVVMMSAMLNCCSIAYLMLMSNDIKINVTFALIFIVDMMAVFSCYHNGQRIFNQNEIFRRALAELPWTDKPQWFKQSLQIIITRANTDIEMRPYDIYVMNYVSFKEFVKTIFSIGNIIYTMKLKHTSSEDQE